MEIFSLIDIALIVADRLYNRPSGAKLPFAETSTANSSSASAYSLIGIALICCSQAVHKA
jgi:hypothetical protein